MHEPKLAELKRIVSRVKLLLILVVSIFTVGISGFMYLKKVSVGQALIYTVEVLTFSHEAEVGVLHYFELALLFFGVVVIWAAIEATMKFAMDGHFRKYFEEVKHHTKLKGMKGHAIICGAGRVGTHVGEKLKKEGKDVLFIESDETVINQLKSAGFEVFNGNATDEKVLHKAGILHASCLAVTLGKDGDNLLVVLAARELNPHIRIAARCNEESIVSKLQKAGADLVILPEVLGGFRLADALLGKIDTSHVIHY